MLKILKQIIKKIPEILKRKFNHRKLNNKSKLQVNFKIFFNNLLYFQSFLLILEFRKLEKSKIYLKV